MVRSDTSAPPPANAPNATPVLRTFVRSMPKKTLIESPRLIDEIAICFVIWSSAMNSAAAMAARRHASSRFIAAGPAARPWVSALDEIYEDPADNRQDQDRHDRAQVERARPDPNHRDDPPEDVQVRVGHVGHEL